MSASDIAHPRQGRPHGSDIPAWVVITALSLLTGLQPITTDLYLPALPQMQRALGLNGSAVQWTLSVLILAFGFGQLIWGPVADRIGRQPVLRWGLGFYVLASMLTVIAQDLDVMIMARAAQGASLAASVVCGRAMIRDLFAPEQGARQQRFKGMAGELQEHDRLLTSPRGGRRAAQAHCSSARSLWARAAPRTAWGPAARRPSPRASIHRRHRP